MIVCSEGREKGLRVSTLPILQGPYRAAGQALEVIPRTLAQNCGTNVIRALTKLRARHSEEGAAPSALMATRVRIHISNDTMESLWVIHAPPLEA